MHNIKHRAVKADTMKGSKEKIQAMRSNYLENIEKISSQANAYIDKENKNINTLSDHKLRMTKPISAETIKKLAARKLEEKILRGN